MESASIKYIESKPDAQKIVDYIIRKDEPIGFDTEFEGVDFDEGDNCVGRAVLDVWSLAVFDGGYSPRGFRTAKGVVISREALPWFSSILENKGIKKYAHNAVVDVHTCFNCGIDVVGVIDTLSLVRFVIPGRLKNGLDILAKEYLDDSKFEHFKTLFTEPIFEDRAVEYKWCPYCERLGEDEARSCRRRKSPHLRYSRVEMVSHETRGRKLIPISSVRPGHPLWERYKAYAAQDSVLALELGDFLVNKAKEKKYDNPFIS